MDTYHIVYPGGERDKLTVIELSIGIKYELSDYDVASRKEFFDEDEAILYAKKLAYKNDKIYVGDDEDGLLD